MAKKLELSNPHVAALMRQHKKLIPWRSASYNDEVTLMDLRDSRPTVDWGTIRDLFNQAIPASRRRSIDSIKNKWRSLKNQTRIFLQLEVLEPFEGESISMEKLSATHMIPDALLNVGCDLNESMSLHAPPASASTFDGSINNHTPIEDQSFISLDTLNRNFSEYHEMLSTHWDGMNDFEGHLAWFTDEVEKLEAAKSMAIAAASGCSAGQTR